MGIKYWAYRYDAERGGYVPAAGDYTTNRAHALRYIEGHSDKAIYRYDLPATVPHFIESEKLPNGSFIDDLQLQPPGRPVEREGTYRRITLEIREDLLTKVDAHGKSRREIIEQALEQFLSPTPP